MISVRRGFLIEYGLSIPPLVLSFEFNPRTISRSRSITVKTGDLPGNRGGYGFLSPLETPRAAQGVTMEPETFSITILLDATDRMDEGNAIASAVGVQPEIDMLRSMVEPKVQGPLGLSLLGGLGAISPRALSHREHPSVLLFIWGASVLPVFLTSISIDEQAHLPSLLPYRAEADLGMRVIESANLFYDIEKIRQTAGAIVHLATEVEAGIEAVF